jgi:hypothetical protein
MIVVHNVLYARVMYRANAGVAGVGACVTSPGGGRHGCQALKQRAYRHEPGSSALLGSRARVGASGQPPSETPRSVDRFGQALAGSPAGGSMARLVRVDLTGP